MQCVGRVQALTSPRTVQAALIASIAVASAACGADTSSGEYQIAWTLTRAQGPGSTSCADLAVDHVTATITDVATNDTTTESAPCSAGSMVTAPLPLGDHTITLDAFGTAGERASTFGAQTHGTLATNGQTIALPSQPLAIDDPITHVHSTWTLTYKGAPSSCAELAPNGIAIVVVPAGGTARMDIWDCTEPNATTDLAPTALTAHAELLGTGDAIVSTSADVKVDAARGQIDLVFALDWP